MGLVESVWIPNLRVVSIQLASDPKTLTQGSETMSRVEIDQNKWIRIASRSESRCSPISQRPYGRERQCSALHVSLPIQTCYEY